MNRYPKDYEPITTERLEVDMKERPDYYFGQEYSCSTIRGYVARNKIPCIQHVIDKNKLKKSMCGKLTVYPAEVRLWIAFGRSYEAALKVVKMRDMEKIAELTLSLITG
jgi:hypothetical protein